MSRNEGAVVHGRVGGFSRRVGGVVRGIVVAVVVVLAAAGGAGTVRAQTPVEAGIRDGVLLKGNGTEPESLDPHVVIGAPEWTIVLQLFEALVALDPVSLAPGPGAAESWEVSADGLVVTFRLREGLVWSNGDPLTAEDWVWSARRMLSPGLGSSHAEDTLLFVAGARAYQRGEVADPSAVGVRAVDARTVEFRLERPTPFFPSALAYFFPVHRATVEAAGGGDRRGSGWDRPGKLVGNGPFVLAAWDPQKVVEVRRNPRWRGAARVRLEAIRFFPIENPATEEAAYRDGQLHLTATVPVQRIDAWRRERSGELVIVPDLGIYFYTVNVARGGLADVRVRRALSLAVDRQELTDFVLRGGQQPAEGFTPPGLPGYETPGGLVHDPDEARALLAEAGYPGGKGLPPVEVLFDNRGVHRAVAEAVQAMWRRELGVDARLRQEETRSLLGSKRSMGFDLVRGSWNATSYLDPYYFLGPWKTGALYNEAKWTDAAYDRWIGEVETILDPERRMELFREAEARLLDQMPVVPLFATAAAYLRHPAVRGMGRQAFADRFLAGVWLER